MSLQLLLLPLFPIPLSLRVRVCLFGFLLLRAVHYVAFVLHRNILYTVLHALDFNVLCGFKREEKEGMGPK